MRLQTDRQQRQHRRHLQRGDLSHSPGSVFPARKSSRTVRYRIRGTTPRKAGERTQSQITYVRVRHCELCRLLLQKSADVTP
jgi:hypothetical protein